MLFVADQGVGARNEDGAAVAVVQTILADGGHIPGNLYGLLRVAEDAIRNHKGPVSRYDRKGAFGASAKRSA